MDLNHRKHYKLPKNKIKNIIRDSILCSENTYCDQLDCSVSFTRQPTTKTVDDVLEIALKDKTTIWVFIYRKQMGAEKDYFDVGCRTGRNPEYFLWIKLNVENGVNLIQKYNLKPI